MTALNGEQYSQRISQIAASLNDLGRQRIEGNDDRLKHLHPLQNELQIIRKEIESELVALGLKPPSKRVGAFFDFLERAYRYLFKQEILIGLAIKSRLLRDPVIQAYRQAQLEADITLADIEAMRHRIGRSSAT
jgi:hypothetical protein